MPGFSAINRSSQHANSPSVPACAEETNLEPAAPYSADVQHQNANQGEHSTHAAIQGKKRPAMTRSTTRTKIARIRPADNILESARACVRMEDQIERDGPSLNAHKSIMYSSLLGDNVTASATVLPIYAHQTSMDAVRSNPIDTSVEAFVSASRTSRNPYSDSKSLAKKKLCCSNTQSLSGILDLDLCSSQIQRHDQRDSLQISYEVPVEDDDCFGSEMCEILPSQAELLERTSSINEGKDAKRQSSQTGDQIDGIQRPQASEHFDFDGHAQSRCEQDHMVLVQRRCSHNNDDLMRFENEATRNFESEVMKADSAARSQAAAPHRSVKGNVREVSEHEGYAGFIESNEGQTTRGKTLCFLDQFREIR
ncbi:hypothetical protein K431DRAFT_335190 [Polychaeton citri CBS 116435]|uniref:Uncharacterized protein n=1 Tax=Polychaeton citri CBS 116435 TaxID=1314669 RepID=A0A9P4UIG4_9PEZI|nr:hypothetical protein K431DRAFT_335190 [Polychaeton citri CBS 116435]